MTWSGSLADDFDADTIVTLKAHFDLQSDLRPSGFRRNS
jgi:hypothetical protein